MKIKWEKQYISLWHEQKNWLKFLIVYSIKHEYEKGINQDNDPTASISGNWQTIIDGAANDIVFREL